MALYHFSAKIIGRKDGRSSTAAAAYRHAAKFMDERTGQTFNYSSKGEVEASFLFLPEGAPDWMHDREKLWNSVELHNKRKDAQLAREIVVALPREIPKEAQHDLIKDFAQREFVSRGMVADIAIHRPMASDGRDQPHAHIMLSLNHVDASKPHGFGMKAREWNNPALLQGLRFQWEKAVNAAYEQHNMDLRVSASSYAKRGIAKVPQVHLGPQAWRGFKDKNIVSDRLQRHMAITSFNGAMASIKGKAMSQVIATIPGGPAALTLVKAARMFSSGKAQSKRPHAQQSQQQMPDNDLRQEQALTLKPG